MLNEQGESTIVASFPKGATEIICVGRSEYKGKSYVFVRIYVAALDGGFIPTAKGISLPLEKCSEFVQGVRALGEVMGPDRVVARIQKNRQQQVWVAATEFKGHRLIDIRTYASFGGRAELVPLQKGVSMNVELIQQLLEAIEKLEATVG